MSQVFADLHGRVSGTSRPTGKTGLASPPDFAAVAKANTRQGPSDSDIEGMSLADATEALMQRQRAYHRQRLGLA